MPRRHLDPESYQPCPLCGEPISIQAQSCFHCGADERSAERREPVVVLLANDHTRPLRGPKILPPKNTLPNAFKYRRWLRGQNFQVIALMFCLSLLLPLIGPLVLKLFGNDSE